VSTKINIPPRIVRAKIAAFASVDERVVHTFLRGTVQTRPSTKAAILSAMHTLGLDHLAPREAVKP
jgi:hypothetical protein